MIEWQEQRLWDNASGGVTVHCLAWDRTTMWRTWDEALAAARNHHQLEHSSKRMQLTPMPHYGPLVLWSNALGDWTYKKALWD